MTRFDIHWSPVSDAEATVGMAPGLQLYALWPAPVNPDTCFQAAGFTDFGDADPGWDAAADELGSQLLHALGKVGTPRLLSTPLMSRCSWHRRWRGQCPQTLPLIEQLRLPQHEDSLGDCLISFGGRGVTLRTGQGHQLYWITWPQADTAKLHEIVSFVADAHPLFQTSLRWSALRARHH